MRINAITITNYRSLCNVSLKLRALNVVIGANGSGKTTLLDTFELLQRGASGELSSAISNRGGLHSMLTALPAKTGEGDRLGIDLDVECPGKLGPAAYSLSVAQQGLGHEVLHEDFRARPSERSRQLVTWFERRAQSMNLREKMPGGWWGDLKRGELVLAQPTPSGRVWLHVQKSLAGTRRLGALSVGPSSPIWNAQPVDPVPLFPSANGQDLIGVLYNVKTLHPDTYARILSTLRTVLPGFQSLEFPSVATGQLALQWRDASLTRPLFAHELSEGTLRFLWLVTALLSPAPPALLLIDEPEVSLHPEMLKVLSGVLREAADRMQVIVATHSDRLLRWLEPADLVVMDLENGRTTVQRGDDPALDMKRWLADFSLDELWLMGELGGRP